MSTIYIKGSETYRTRIEDVTDINLFFYPVYKQARDCVAEIVSDTRKYQTSPELLGARNFGSSEFNPLKLRGYPNNIIAFCANRGHGKTSAMLSFSAALESIVSPGVSGSATDSSFWSDPIKSCRFLVLDSIDPTAMEKTDSIIRTILSRMFQVFSTQSFAGYLDQNTRESRQRLLTSFQTCFRLADLQKDTSQHNDDYPPASEGKA